MVINYQSRLRNRGKPDNCFTTASYTNSVKYSKIRVITKFGKITQNRTISPFKVIQGHRYWYQSKAHIRLLIKTIARQVLRIINLEFTNLLGIYTVGVARSLCRRLL